MTSHKCVPDASGEFCQTCGGRLREPEPRAPVLDERAARKRADEVIRSLGYTEIRYMQDEF